MDEITTLKKRFRELEAEIREAERRLPAHSTKPTTMQILLELEDERDDLVKRIEALKKTLYGYP